MPKKMFNNVKLGVFVIAGLLFLILLLYMIGKNENLFGETYILKARFRHVQGIVAGNDVRYSGISAGTVKMVTIQNDTTIEVSMVLEKKMKKYIRKNAVVSISTDGFVGNKIVNIVPASEPAALAGDGDLLVVKRSLNTDDMLQVLDKTNNNAAEISEDLKVTVQRLNNSVAFWALLNDETIPANLKNAVANIKSATVKADLLAGNFNQVIAGIQTGKGLLGAIITDSTLAINLNDAIVKIKQAGDEAYEVAKELKMLVTAIKTDLDSAKGIAGALLKDSALTSRLHTSLNNIQKGTDGFNQNMEALKHNFLFRRYFKKLGNQKKNEAATDTANSS